MSEPELAAQTVVVIGGSAGIGLETARRARKEGADVILTGCDAGRFSRVATELGALNFSAFDALHHGPLEQFFRDLANPIDHVIVTAGQPHYGRLIDLDAAQARDALSERLVLFLQVARHAAGKIRPGGSLLLVGLATHFQSVASSLQPMSLPSPSTS